MIKDILKQLVVFVFYLLLQVLVINNLPMAWFINPFVYIGFVLLLPVDTPKWLLLVAAFVMGLMVDMFASTPGMHASATVLTAFARHYLYAVILPRDDFQPATIPNVATFGFPWFIKYVALMVTVHHFMLFLVEAFSLAQLHTVILKTVAGGLVTIALLVLAQLFSLGKYKTR